MTGPASPLKHETLVLEKTLGSGNFDFINKYLAVRGLRSMIGQGAGAIRPQTISVLEEVLKDPALARRRQSLFLFREAARALVMVLLAHGKKSPLARQSVSALKRILQTVGGTSLVAVTEALAGLPLAISGPDVQAAGCNDHLPTVSWEELARRNGGAAYCSTAFAGRSLIARDHKGEKILVVKLARVDDLAETLGCEALWMEHLRSVPTFPVRFDIPCALKFESGYVFRLQSLPVAIPPGLNLHPKFLAITFMADKEYFSYVNDDKKQLGFPEFQEVICRNAWLLGKMASLGIIHTAPIPLFHNRVQQGRRSDGGLYEWPRGGRLDRWLGSSRHPNMGLTGLRDFEHLEAVDGKSDTLSMHIGVHFLSLLLVGASYFRFKDSTRIGFDPDGRPVDARDLFDAHQLEELISGMFTNYYKGFAGQEFTEQIPVDLKKLAARMIDEMGVDRYMEEVFRAEDQRQMSDDRFQEFLLEHGFSARQIRARDRGAHDIVINTGPHLGGFNQRISIPELIDAVGTLAATCLLGRYLHTECDCAAPF